MLRGAAVVGLCECEPAPWCCKGVRWCYRVPCLSEVIHVLASRSWWGCKGGEEEQQQHIGELGWEGTGGGVLMAFQEQRGRGLLAASRSRGLWAAPPWPGQPPWWSGRYSYAGLPEAGSLHHTLGAQSLSHCRQISSWKPWLASSYHSPQRCPEQWWGSSCRSAVGFLCECSPLSQLGGGHHP